jgi:Asp-tRNA(Asn)/Glu-tRNA(Gln) amidotransferase C subunit
MLGLEKTIKLQIEKGGFDMIYDTQVIYNQSNLMFYSFVSVFGIIIITAIIIRPRYCRRAIAPTPPKPTILEPSKLKLEETGYENISEYIERMEKYVAELNDLRAQGIIDEQTYESIRSGLMTKIMNLSNRLKEDVFRLKQEIAVRQKKLKILAERYSKGVLSETSYLEILGKLISKMKQLNNELAQKQDILQRLERLGK